MIKDKHHPYFLLGLQVIAHLMIIPMIVYGSWYHWIGALFVYFLTGCFGMTMTFHRLLSHRSWNAPKWFEKVGTFLGTYGLTGSSLGWVAIHREHHRYSDTEEDPHSPEHDGFIKTQWLSMFHRPNIRYVKDLLRDPYHTFLHRNYFYIHFAAIAILTLIDPFSVVWAWGVPAAILWNAGSAVNTVNHMFGYRNYETQENSRNNFLTGYLIWGEGWHNNHHADSKNPIFGQRWWEVDPGGFFIQVLQKR